MVSAYLQMDVAVSSKFRVVQALRGFLRFWLLEKSTEEPFWTEYERK
jgi:hypothetical protein